MMKRFTFFDRQVASSVTVAAASCWAVSLPSSSPRACTSTSSTKKDCQRQQEELDNALLRQEQSRYYPDVGIDKNNSSSIAANNRTQREEMMTVAAQHEQARHSQFSAILNPNEAFLAHHAQRAIDANKVSPEAANYAQALFRRMGGDCDPIVSKARELIGDQNVADLTQYQKQMYGTILQADVSNAVAQATLSMFQEQKGIQEFAQDGKPTGENYWFEAAGTLTTPDLPREMKDDLFAEMMRDRKDGSTAATSNK